MVILENCMNQIFLSQSYASLKLPAGDKDQPLCPRGLKKMHEVKKQKGFP